MAMKTVPKTATAENAYGKPLTGYKDKDGNALPSKIKYPYEYKMFPTTGDMIEAGAGLTPAQQLKVVNAKANTKARQAAYTETMKALGIDPPNEENSVVFRLKMVAKGFLGQFTGKKNADGSPMHTPDEAKALARAKAAEALGEEWPEDEDDED